MNNDKSLQELYEILARTKTKKDIKNFLNDLCTISELRAFAERWDVVKLLNKGIPYRTISKQIGASTATVTRVARFLNDGNGGYKKELKKESLNYL